jgi:hypothetical protein
VSSTIEPVDKSFRGKGVNGALASFSKTNSLSLILEMRLRNGLVNMNVLVEHCIVLIVLIRSAVRHMSKKIFET